MASLAPLPPPLPRTIYCNCSVQLPHPPSSPTEPSVSTRDSSEGRDQCQDGPGRDHCQDGPGLVGCPLARDGLLLLGADMVAAVSHVTSHIPLRLKSAQFHVEGSSGSSSQQAYKCATWMKAVRLMEVSRRLFFPPMLSERRGAASCELKARL